ncbi:Hpt domain-containing protein [Paracoccus sulfuroxidans]|uniref:Hpt domain-containing protein n=2 Tax=Paracoccus sulfuroxidans TaxID=384678 RepID=A0A562NFR8_9RHOB|nr:Hpt domain-containing protein [Paracoccus sulfuroxidans]
MIDWARIVELRDEVGEEEFSPLLELFLDEIESVIMRLPHNDADRMWRDLHFLKGCARNLGFRSLGCLCEAGERQCARNPLAGLRIADVLSCYAESKLLLMRDLSRHDLSQPQARPA